EVNQEPGAEPVRISRPLAKSGTVMGMCAHLARPGKRRSGWARGFPGTAEHVLEPAALVERRLEAHQLLAHVGDRRAARHVEKSEAENEGSEVAQNSPAQFRRN